MENIGNNQLFYAQSLELLKRIQFQILLQPLDPEAGRVIRHKLDFIDCIPGVDEGVYEVQSPMSMIQSVYQTIEFIKETYKDRYNVTLEKVITPNQEPAYNTDSEDSGTDTESDISDNEFDSDDSDSDSDDVPRRYDSEADNKSSWDLDSEVQTYVESFLDSETDVEA